MIDLTIAEKKVNAANKNKTGMVGRRAGRRMNSSLKARSWKNVVARVSGDSPPGLTAAAGCVFTNATAENAGGITAPRRARESRIRPIWLLFCDAVAQ
jgi:hypothetical protein